MSVAKARTLMAKYQSYSNASEFIRGHGEEGFSFDDQKFQDSYLKQNEILAKKLDKKASYYYQKYLELGIEIDCSDDLCY